jgi:hypothetical protein
MTKRLFQQVSFVATALVVFGTSTARAVCTIADVHPTATVPTPWSGDGERFIFEASADCVSVEFTSGAFSATPVPGPRGGSGGQYHVNVRPSVWNRLVRASDTTFEWTVKGWTTAGVLTEVTTTNELDFDGDGWTRRGGDDHTCDYDPARHPGATETCDRVDQDCNGRIDDVILFRDADRDGYGDDADWLVGSCDGVRGHVDVGGDCDDTDATISPAATEVCDDVDDDCDGYASCTLSLADADAEYTGEVGGDCAGRSVAGAGDVDGDGYGDVVVGAEYNSEGAPAAGAAYLVLGGPSPASGSLSGADAKYTGEGVVDLAGVSVAGAGDVDGDGYDDLLIGGEEYPDHYGAAYLVLGGPSPASASLSTADAKYTGEATGDYTFNVAGAGDVDGDDYDDVLVGTYRNGDGGIEAGAAYLVLGGPSPASGSLSVASVVYTGQAYDRAGSVAGAGDVNGDGYGDILVGAYGSDDGGTDAGLAYLLLGGPSPASASLSVADAEYTGENDLDCAGLSVAGAGDVDADGYGDMLVEAPYNDDGAENGGATYLLLGGPSPASESLSDADAEYAGQVDDDYAGAQVAGAGDVDGDGYGDVLVGADGFDHHDGAAYLLLGGPSPASMPLRAADATYTGRRHEYAGIGVAGAGDVDSDGYDDVLVGAYENSDDGSLSGAAYLVLGGVL